MRPHDCRFFVDAAQVVLGDAAMDHDAVVLIALRKHFAMRGQIGLQPAIFDARFDIDVEEIMAQCARSPSPANCGKPGPAAGADRQRIRIAAQQAIDARCDRAARRSC